MQANACTVKWNGTNKKQTNPPALHAPNILTHNAHIELKRWNEWRENIFFFFHSLSSHIMEMWNVKCKLAGKKHDFYNQKVHNRLTVWVCALTEFSMVMQSTALIWYHLHYRYQLCVSVCVCALSSGKTPSERESERVSEFCFLLYFPRRLFVYPFGICVWFDPTLFPSSIHLFIKSINFFLFAVVAAAAIDSSLFRLQFAEKFLCLENMHSEPNAIFKG